MPRSPQVSGNQLARLLERLGYEFVRQRGSHAHYRFISDPYSPVPISYRPFPKTAPLPTWINWPRRSKGKKGATSP